MPISKNHNKKECHSKKRKRYAKHKFNVERKWKAKQEEELLKLKQDRKSRMDKLREKLNI